METSENMTNSQKEYPNWSKTHFLGCMFSGLE